LLTVFDSHSTQCHVHVKCIVKYLDGIGIFETSFRPCTLLGHNHQTTITGLRSPWCLLPSPPNHSLLPLPMMLSMALYCVQAKNIDDAFDSCNEVLAAEPDNIDALCDRAETYINNEQYEEGTTLFSDFVYIHCV